MFIDYNGTIPELRKQHNIMIFIGNGFDISVLSKYRKDKLISSYSKFYDYLCYKGFNEENVLFNKMTEDKRDCKENWSDFENSLGELIEEGVLPANLKKALREIQEEFLYFLNELVTPEVLLEVNRDSEENKWASTALSNFLGDLCEEDYKKINFSKGLYHYDMYNYLFVNFNYTSLFDSYIFLDKEQFDPEMYDTVDRNFKFYADPKNYLKKKLKMNHKDSYSSYLMTSTIHPHGYQSIPRSLIFGVEKDKYTSREDKEKRKFNKSYWVQNDRKYKRSIDNTELFIIFGASAGETDSWWWRNIRESLLKENSKSELIIYHYNDDINCDKDKVKENFIEACRVENEETEETSKKLKEKIYVISYNDNKKINMFGFKDWDVEKRDKDKKQAKAKRQAEAKKRTKGKK